MKWFRYWDDALDDPKVQKLPPVLFKHWVNLLCLASKASPRGTLPDVAGIAFRLRLPEAKAMSVIEDLMSYGLLELTGDTLHPHNWDGRQRVSDDVSQRVRKHRSNVSGNVTGPLHETPPEEDTETDSEQNRGEVDGAADASPDPAAQPVETSPKPKPAQRRATRIPPGWRPSEALLDWATRPTGEGGVGLPRDFVLAETELFRDYFLGSGGAKLDWDATWRTWMHKAAKERRAPAGSRARAPTGATLTHRADQVDWSAEKRRVEERRATTR